MTAQRCPKWASGRASFTPPFSGQGEVWALVVPYSGVPGRGTFYYKALTEEMGPTADTCPDRILDLLTPSTHEATTEWRERCREHNAAMEALKRGALVRFAAAYLTPDGPCNVFRCVDAAKGRFKAESGAIYTLRGWRAEPFALLEGTR